MKRNVLTLTVFLVLALHLNGQISADFRSIISEKSDLTLHFVSYLQDTVTYSYNWDFGDGSTGSGPSIEHTYVKQGGYIVSLTVTDGNNIESISREMKLQAPFEITNVFTPNNDGINDLFVVHSDGSTNYTLSIYSRSGTLVHRSTSITPVWDGKTPSGEYVHPGVYYYIVKAGSTSGDFEKSGFVHLIREKEK